jgi:hypothetical protein
VLISVAEVISCNSPLMIAIVPSEFTEPGSDHLLAKRIGKYFLPLPVVLISVEKNGPRAHAPWQTHVFLALLQLEKLELSTLDLNVPPPEDELPF